MTATKGTTWGDALAIVRMLDDPAASELLVSMDAADLRELVGRLALLVRLAVGAEHVDGFADHVVQLEAYLRANR